MFKATTFFCFKSSLTINDFVVVYKEIKQQMVLGALYHKYSQELDRIMHHIYTSMSKDRFVNSLCIFLVDIFTPHNGFS